MTSLPPVQAAARWANNGALIADVARLGYITDTDRVIDVTYGRGRFWTKYRPARLVAHDLKLDGVDFRYLPHPDASFDVHVIDGPYKLNGTADLGDFDEAYGIDVPADWQERHQLIADGMTEGARVLAVGGRMLVKCQAQVCSGAVRWQDDIFTAHGESLGLVKVDRFDLIGKGRPQPMKPSARYPNGREQRHAHGRPSTLLVFKAPANNGQLDLLTHEG